MAILANHPNVYLYCFKRSLWSLRGAGSPVFQTIHKMHAALFVVHLDISYLDYDNYYDYYSSTLLYYYYYYNTTFITESFQKAFLIEIRYYLKILILVRKNIFT